MDKSKHKRKKKQSQTHTGDSPHNTLASRNSKADATNRNNRQNDSDHEKHIWMRLSEIIKRSSVTDWLLTIFTGILAAFTGILAAFAITQFIIIRRQLDVMRIDERAWLSITQSEDISFVPSQPVTVTLAIANIGKSAARQINRQFYIEIISNDGSPLHFETMGQDHSGLFQGTMTPNANAPVKVVVVRGGPAAIIGDKPDTKYVATAAERDALTAGKAWIAVHAFMSYYDVFGAQHWVRFCDWSFFKKNWNYKTLACAQYNDTDNN